MAMSRSGGGRSVTSRSPIEIVPSVISSSPAIIRRRVDFPHPEGPTSTMNSPSAIVRLTSSTATTPAANSFVTCSSVISAMGSRSVSGLHSAHPVDLRLDRHVAGVDGEDGAGDRDRFVAREIDDEWGDLLGRGDGEDVQALDRRAGFVVVE